ncbi:MAG: transketolase [Deltaproteobacteria bacterium]|nr:transketolase [Deltaproteobacteria bacterium]
MLDKRSKMLRRMVLEMVKVGSRGHIGPALSLIEILRVLYDSILQFRPEQPDWANRDRFILSKGHGCLALYAILADKGFFDLSELNRFCLPNSILGGHPERGKVPGVEASTGALGHGLPIGVGMALSAKIRKQNHKVVVVTGDGEINEGSVWEAAMSAAKHQLNNLSILVDYNKLQSYGPVKEVLNLEPLVDKWKSFGFEVREVDGHDINAMQSLLEKLPFDSDRPSTIICNTTKGKGFPFAENNPKWHHKSGLKEADFKSMYDCLKTETK